MPPFPRNKEGFEWATVPQIPRLRELRKMGKKLHKILPEGKLQGELLPAAPLQPCAGPCQGGDICSLTGFTWPHVIIPATYPPCAWGTHPPLLSMAPYAEASHLAGFTRLLGFYPSLASRFSSPLLPTASSRVIIIINLQ